jgi:general secretion pathway protein G
MGLGTRVLACHRRTRRHPIIRWAGTHRGLTLIELVIVLAVIATLSTIALTLYYDYRYQAQIARAVADIANISSEIQTFHMMNERLPVNLAEVDHATFKDPWGNPYEYFDIEFGSGGQPRKDHNLHPLNSDFDLYSKGKDGDSTWPLTASKSRDDIIRANDGQFIGLASKY